MIVNMKPLLQHAADNGYAVPAFDIINLETVLGVMDAAEKKDSPVIMMVYEGFLQHAPLDALVAIVWEIADKSDIPVAFHLDHGSNLDLVKKAVQKGFSSVMYDGSTLAYEENLKNTAKIVEIAHRKGVDVEAELGHVGQGNNYSEDVKNFYTDPELALDFVEKTGVDALAVAIGTAHGTYKGEPKLDFDRLKEIKQKVGVPLVLHGGSGTGEEKIRQAVALGICKLNIFTDLAKGVEAKISENCASLSFIDVLRITKEEFTTYSIDYINLVGSANKAEELEGLDRFAWE